MRNEDNSIEKENALRLVYALQRHFCEDKKGALIAMVLNYNSDQLRVDVDALVNYVESFEDFE